jgi:hypothetical protein
MDGRCRQLESIMPQVLQLNTVRKRMKAKPALLLVVAIWTVMRRTEKASNKAPEPTTFAVTSRAIVRTFEMKRSNPNRDAARAAPAKVVAHL